MTNVFAPRAGIASLIASLSKWGMQIIDIVEGSPSVGAAGQVNASDGAGAWIVTQLFQAGPTEFESRYSDFTFAPIDPDGDLASGINMQRINWGATVSYIVRTGDPRVVALNLLPASGTTRSANRVLVAGGGTNSDNWIDPQAINNLIVSTAVNLVVSTSSVLSREVTVLCTAGGLTITLPNPVGFGGRRVSVKDRNGLAGATPGLVNVSGGSTIDGAAAVNLNVNYQCLNFQCDGVNWFQV
jgi:hypothetical protein